MKHRFALGLGLAVALTALSVPAAAQVKLSLAGGLARPSAKIDFEDGADEDIRSEYRPSVGLAAALPLTDAFAIQLGANYTVKGSVGSVTLSGAPAEWAHKVGYVEASALARLGTEFGPGGLSGHLLAGPTVARETSCDLNFAVTLGGGSSTIQDGPCEEAGLERSMWDYGVAGGAGVEYLGASGVGFVLTGLYTYGLVDVDQDDDGGLWHRVLTFRAGLVFSIG